MAHRIGLDCFGDAYNVSLTFLSPAAPEDTPKVHWRLTHVPDASLLPTPPRVLRTKRADSVRLYPLQDVASKVLPVYLPVGFEILARAHEQPRRPARVAVDERRQVVNAATEGVPERILVVVLLDLLEGYGGEVGAGGGLVEVGPRGIGGVVPILAVSIKN